VRVAVTGTPGTGKTTAVDRIATVAPDSVAAGLTVVHLNDLVREEGLATGEDETRGSLVADLDAVRERFAGREDLVVESHLAHHLDVDRVVVLRCRPSRLESRLRDRGEPGPKAAENAEAEALDVVLAEAVDRHGRGRVYEVDTTDRDPDAVARAIVAVVAGEREPSAGEVDFTDYL
jgi:adenylate kinase